MPIGMHVAVLTISALIAALFSFPIAIQREGILFGVPVGASFAKSKRAIKLRMSYLACAGVLAISGSSLSLWNLSDGRIIAVVATVAGELLSFGLLRAHFWRSVLPHRCLDEEGRSASVGSTREGLYMLLAAIAFVPSALAAISLWKVRQAVLFRSGMHWTLFNDAHGISHSSTPPEMAPLIVGALITTFSVTVVFAARRRSPGYLGRDTLTRLYSVIVLIAACVLSTIASLLSLKPLNQLRLEERCLLSSATALCAICCVGAALLSSRHLRAELAAAQRSTDVRYWIGGIFYVNREDPALLVPKRDGAGYSYNYGRPLVWTWIFCVVSAASAILYLVRA